jgi:hypothetical protein
MSDEESTDLGSSKCLDLLECDELDDAEDMFKCFVEPGNGGSDSALESSKKF